MDSDDSDYLPDPSRYPPEPGEDGDHHEPVEPELEDDEDQHEPDDPGPKHDENQREPELLPAQKVGGKNNIVFIR